MVSLQIPVFSPLHPSEDSESEEKQSSHSSSQHPNWKQGESWKDTLNNLRLVMQPWFLFGLVASWLDLFSNEQFVMGISAFIFLS